MIEDARTNAERTVWRAIQAIAAQKYRNPCNRLLLDINAVCDAAIADLHEVIRRHDGES
jgi:hypothetical protein